MSVYLVDRAGYPLTPELLAQVASGDFDFEVSIAETNPDLVGVFGGQAEIPLTAEEATNLVNDNFKPLMESDKGEWMEVEFAAGRCRIPWADFFENLCSFVPDDGDRYAGDEALPSEDEYGHAPIETYMGII
ncbi:hypothetical protein GYA54_04745 [Candidatus Kuenenbacteria bacterium]|nr:hypothetical protein [Candidatus Kuenenbacteria bacterium]